jgi:haloalkane dehalogenase
VPGCRYDRAVTSAEVVEQHRAAGRSFEAGGVRSFVREAGQGEPVVCVHGVPVSCLVYSRVIRELAGRGLRGVTFDLPGLGLADRPPDFDYRWSGLGRFCVAAVDALGLDRFHLVVHDIGGPVGFELAAAMPDRIRSLTVLDTLIEVDTFKRPWSMEPFARRGVGEAALATLTKPGFTALVRLQGIKDRSAIPKEEIHAWLELLKREDGGRAFLRIMRGFERTREKRELYVRTLRELPCPKQVIWADSDPALTLEREGDAARRATGVDEIQVLSAKHFLQVDQAAAIADRIAALADASPSGE